MKLKFRANFKQTFNDYYKNQRRWPRYVFIGLIILLLISLFVGEAPKNVPKLDYNHMHFVGNIIPMDGKYFYNEEKLDREIALTKINTAQFVMIHKREQQYFPYFEKILVKNGVPSDFKYLAVAESALRSTAYSRAGAAGIWQFMPSTAKRYGLRVDKEIDERFDLEKSTKAAIAYIIDLYRKFEDWNLVAAAYNRGENGLLRDMQAQHQSGYYDLWLNDETARYVFRIIAIKYLMEHKYEHFTPEILGEQYDLPRTKTIKLRGTDDLALWASEEGFSYAEIRQLNPRIRGNTLPEGKRKIKVFK